MIKLRILNMNGFLKTVNDCVGPVNLIDSGGRKEDINGAYAVQRRLQREYEENKNILTLCLDIPTPRDYLSIVNYYAGDC